MNNDLLKQERDLLVKQIEALQGIGKIYSEKVKKRKRKDEKKQKKEKKKNAPRPSKKPRVVVRPPPSLGKKIKVFSPKTNSQIVIGGAKSAAFKRILFDAQSVKFDKSQLPTQHLISVMSQGMKQGWLEWGQFGIPNSVIEAAAAASGTTLGELYSSSEDEAKPRELEMFAGTFASFWFDMSDPKKYGKDIMSDLAALQNPLTTFIKNIRLQKFDNHPVKMYLEYEVIMARSEYTSEEGVSRGAEERTFTISSCDTTVGTIQASHPGIQVIRSTAGVETAVGKSLAILVEEFSSLKQKGSGWNWVRSKGMTVKMSVMVPGVALKGPSSDKAVANALAKLCPPPDTTEGQVGGNHIGTPGWIVNDVHKKETVFNPHPMTLKKADQNLCFSWAILRAIYPDGVTDPTTGAVLPGLGRFDAKYLRDRGEGITDVGGRGYKQLGNVADLSEAISQGKINHILLPDGVTYPVPLKEEIFAQVEKLNDIALSIFRLGADKKVAEIFPFYASRNEPRPGEKRRKIYLGLLQTQAPRYKKAELNKQPEIVNHFILLWDPFPLLDKNPISKVRVSSEARLAKLSENVIWSESGQAWEKKQVKLCDNCLNTFATSEDNDVTYQHHREACMNDKPTLFELPKPERSKLTFRNFKYTEVHPFVIYADLEAVTVPKEGEEWKGSTELLNDHQVRDCKFNWKKALYLRVLGWLRVRALPIPYFFLLGELLGLLDCRCPAVQAPFRELRRVRGETFFRDEEHGRVQHHVRFLCRSPVGCGGHARHRQGGSRERAHVSTGGRSEYGKGQEGGDHLSILSPTPTRVGPRYRGTVGECEAARLRTNERPHAFPLAWSSNDGNCPAHWLGG